MEEVGVVLLSGCQGVHAKDYDRKHEVCLHDGVLSGVRHHRASDRARVDAEH